MNFSTLLAQATQDKNNTNMNLFASLVSARYAESKTTSDLGSFANAMKRSDQALNEMTVAYPAIESFVLDAVSESWADVLTKYVDRTTFLGSDVKAESIQGLLFLNCDVNTIQEIANDYGVNFNDALDFNLFVNHQAIKLLSKELNVIGHSLFGISARSHRDATILLDDFIQHSLEILEATIVIKAPNLLDA